MARPIKEHANWFKHDADASSDDKLIYIESLFGLTGYAFYFKMLEILTRSNNFEVELSTLKTPIYAKKRGVSVDDFKTIVEALTIPELEIFVLTDDGRLYSEGLKKRLEPLLTKRERDRNRQNDVSGNENPVIASENPVIASERKQSIEEHSIEEHRRAEKSIEEHRKPDAIDASRMPLSNAADALNALRFLLQRYSKPQHKEMSKRKADKLFKESGASHVMTKIEHFNWIMKHRPSLAKEPGAYLAKSIEDHYPAPAGYDDFLKKKESVTAEPDPF